MSDDKWQPYGGQEKRALDEREKIHKNERIKRQILEAETRDIQANRRIDKARVRAPNQAGVLPEEQQTRANEAERLKKHHPEIAASITQDDRRAYWQERDSVPPKPRTLAEMHPEIGKDAEKGGKDRKRGRGFDR